MLTISLTFILLFSPATTLMVVQGKSEDTHYSIKSTVTYVNPNRGDRIWNLTEEDRTIGLFMNNSWQSVDLKSTTYSLEALKNDIDGNNIAVLRLPKQQLYHGENVSYTVEYHMAWKPRVIPNISEDESGTLEVIPPDLRETYTRAEGPWLIKDPTLVNLAHEIAGNETNVLKIIKGFVGWIWRNINPGTHEFPLYPDETLIVRQGDCDDQAILLVTLSRIMGIPSHLQIGSIYMPNRDVVNETVWDSHVRLIQRKIGWHGWAMVYVPPWGLLPVDLTYVSTSYADPLNAIRYGAVVSQKTIQYINISKVDYVAESRQARSFILENGFYVYSEDEMAEIVQTDSPGSIDPVIAVALGTLTVVLLVGSLLIARQWRRHLKKPEVPVPASS